MVTPADLEREVPERVRLEDPRGSLTLIEPLDFGDLNPKVRWAGDLDGDGSLDLVLEYNDDWQVVDLFLSRGRPASGKWEPAAVTSHGGC